MHSRAQFPLQVLLLTVALCLGVARTGHAGSTTGQFFHGTTSATFSTPVPKDGLSGGTVTSTTQTLDSNGKVVPSTLTVGAGNLIDASGNPVVKDNSTTAVSTTAVCNPPCSGFNTALSNFTWGSNSNPLPVGIMPFSSFTFIGVNTDLACGGQAFETAPSVCSSGVKGLSSNAGVGVLDGAEFTMGKFTFLNGTSALESLVFGVTLSVSWTPVSCPLGICPTFIQAESGLTIKTTDNAGPDQNDSVSFTNTEFSTASFNMPEGGLGSVWITGKVVGDPFLLLTAITLVPGSIGSITVVPEPGTLVLLGFGLGLIALTRRLRPVKR